MTIEIKLSEAEAENILTAIEYAYSDHVIPYEELKEVRQRLLEKVIRCKL